MDVDPAHATAYIVNCSWGAAWRSPSCSRPTHPRPSGSSACTPRRCASVRRPQPDLSFPAAYAAPIVMMGQTRAAEYGRLVAETDFEDSQ
jgi:hypothetical protein